MPAYYFVDVREIKNAEKMADYRARINAVVEHFGGRYVVIGGPVQVLDGSYQPIFPVMISSLPSRMHDGGTTPTSTGN